MNKHLMITPALGALIPTAARSAGKIEKEHAQEWDWPPVQPRNFSMLRPRRRRYYQTVEAYQPSGWNSPVTKKIIDIYWRVTITIIKMLIAIPLSIMTIGGIWLLWVLFTL
jgi:hypothetical protein